jgi:protein-disulfide isomerase
MPRPWLTFLTIGTISVIVLVFYSLRLKPVRAPQTETKTIEPGSMSEPTVTFVNPSRGAADAKVTIVEFGDFECDACKELAANLEVALRTFPDDLRVVWKDMPNEDAHPLATPAAIAAHCADRQGKFWEYHDQLFERQSYLSEDEFAKIAVELSLDTEAWQKCYDARDTLPIVRKDFEEGLALGLVATPTIYIGAESRTGALSVEQLTQLIREKLAGI